MNYLQSILRLLTATALLGMAGCRIVELQPGRMYAWVDPPTGYTGTWTLWYSAGGKRVEQTYSAGVKHGTHRSWYETGQLHTETSVMNGKQHGPQKAWNREGRVIASGVCQDGGRWDGTFLEVSSIAEYDSGIFVARTAMDGRSLPVTAPQGPGSIKSGVPRKPNTQPTADAAPPPVVPPAGGTALQTLPLE